MNPACLIISYARKDNVLRLVEEAAKAGIDKIYISLDGPRNKEIRDIQLKLKSELEKSRSGLLGQIWIWQRETNLGSGASVIASLDWAFANEDEVIILEDDLQVEENFFKFMKFGLEEMKNHVNLKIVTGTNPFPGVMDSRLGKLHYPVSWGWATSRLNWLNLRELFFIDIATPPSRFQLNRNLYWQIGKTRALLGQIEAWDVPLASEMYKTEFYTLLPPSNLVCNIGFDRYAAHTKEGVWPLNLSISEYSVPRDYKLDSSLLFDLEKEFENKIFKIRKHHIISWILHKAIDKFRFKPDTKKLLDRTLMEAFPTK
jgi:hypothetical protein